MLHLAAQWFFHCNSWIVLQHQQIAVIIICRWAKAKYWKSLTTTLTKMHSKSTHQQLTTPFILCWIFCMSRIICILYHYGNSLFRNKTSYKENSAEKIQSQCLCSHENSPSSVWVILLTEKLTKANNNFLNRGNENRSIQICKSDNYSKNELQ